MAGPRVIVTRPLAQSGPWIEALRAAGIDARALPLIEIAPLADPAPVHAAWRQLGCVAFVMFVSANAVRHFFALRPGGCGWPDSALAGSTGPGTSAALLAAGVPAAGIAEPAPGAPLETESLWAGLRGRDWRGKRALVVRGEDGRDWLADTMRAAGAEVSFVAAYRRRPPAPDDCGRRLLADALAEPEGHIWLFSSSEAVGHLAALAPGADWSGAHALASHPRIGQAAQRAGFGDVCIVEPRPAAVIEAWRRVGRRPPSIQSSAS